MTTKISATWNDIEVALNEDSLEEKDKATLEAYNRVEPPPSRNPAFHARFTEAKNRIRHKLSLISENEKAQEQRVVAQKQTTDLAQWYVNGSRLIREISKKSQDAQKSRSKTTVAAIKGYLQTDLQSLRDIWPANLASDAFSNLSRHIHFGQKVDYRDILESDLPAIELAAEKHFLKHSQSAAQVGFESLLHGAIRKSSLAQYQQGQFRDAVLNAMIGLFDHVRKRTGSKIDGAKLVNDIFGGAKPMLVFSEIETESGKNDQGGFHKIFLGAVEGIRNPKAHSLDHDLDATKAAQYLIFASLLARRVDECKLDLVG